jgi:hypothetical protein
VKQRLVDGDQRFHPAVGSPAALSLPTNPA